MVDIKNVVSLPKGGSEKSLGADDVSILMHAEISYAFQSLFYLFHIPKP